MLRASRLLLVASAAASIGVIVVIESRAASFAPIVVIFAVAAALFVLATVELERDPRRGKLLAAAAALTLGGMGTLAGFGAGDVTFPAAGLGAIAAWLAAMWRSPRWVRWAFVAYLAAGLVINAPRVLSYLLLPWLLPSVLVWPISAGLSVGGGLIAIYGAFGLAIALAVTAYARPAVFAPRPDPRIVIRDAALAGVAFVGLEAVVALARPNTSAWRELVPVAAVAMFVAAALLAAGVRLVRAGILGGVVMSVAGAALVLYIATARPTVECSQGGVGTSMGPWWLPYSGAGVESGGTSSAGPSRAPQTSSGTITRGDGVTITYTCVAGTLAEFEIRR